MPSVIEPLRYDSLLSLCLNTVFKNPLIPIKKLMKLINVYKYIVNKCY